MNDKFFDLKKEKQDKMINGAMQVFAIKGYKLASTDDMVKVAGVSKGLWFHYFVNKAGLYTFVADYCVKYLTMELSVSLANAPKDYFDILFLVEETKASIAKIYPYAPLMIQAMPTFLLLSFSFIICPPFGYIRFFSSSRNTPLSREDIYRHRTLRPNMLFL